MIRTYNGLEFYELDNESSLSHKAERILNDYCSGKLDLDFTTEDLFDE